MRGWDRLRTQAEWVEVFEGTDAGGTPLLHVTGSDVAVHDLGLRPAASDPGRHGGARGTAITVGDYLYEDTPAWISGVRIRRIHVDRGDWRRANSIALMGAVQDITVHDVTVTGGHTGVAVQCADLRGAIERWPHFAHTALEAECR